MKKNREFHDNESENIRGESIGGAAFIGGRRLLNFLFQMRRLFVNTVIGIGRGGPVSFVTFSTVQRGIPVDRFSKVPKSRS